MFKPKTLFTLNTSKLTKKGEAPILFRITAQNQRSAFSTGYRINPDQWDQSKQRIKGNSELAATFNTYACTLEMKVLQTERELLLTNSQITAQAIVDRLKGNPDENVSILLAFSRHNQHMKELIGRDITQSTYNRYLVTYRKLQTFLSTVQKNSDLPLSKLNTRFITEFEHYLRVNDNICQNTASKYLKNLKKVVRFSVMKEWLQADPFSTFRCRTTPTERGYLTAQELKTLEEKELCTDRLNVVRDLFVFCCYTGLAYSDVQKLNQGHLVKDETGADWIMINRTKTGNESVIPLLPQARSILDKYEDHPLAKYHKRLLPVRSNQKTNEYLREIGNLCGLKKRITSHLARHTFATTVTLANGVSTETVSKMLGHRSLRTTQIYAKMTMGRIAKEMQHMMEASTKTEKYAN